MLGVVGLVLGATCCGTIAFVFVVAFGGMMDPLFYKIRLSIIWGLVVVSLGRL